MVSERTILLERQVKIFVFLSLVWKGHSQDSLTSVFNDHCWKSNLDQREEPGELVSYIDIVVEFCRQLGGASLDDGGAYTIIVRGAPITFSTDELAVYVGIPRLRDAYPNVMSREFDISNDAKNVAEEGSIFTYELNAIIDHEVMDLVVGSYAPLYDGMKSIKQIDLSSFFKIMNLIIANNINH